MITLILCGLFLCVLNLTSFPFCQKNRMSPHSLAAPSKLSSATMAINSIVFPLAHSLTPKRYFCECLVPTLLHRMVKPSASFKPSIICCVPCFFRLLFWLATRVEGLHIATYLLNRLPTEAISTTSPYFTLHGVAPSYEHLRVFGCACYSNLPAKAAHKLAPRSTRCIFLGYSADHKGYWCLDLTNNNIGVSRYVVLDEADFPLSASPHLTNDLDIFM
jgi:hypothetical protein